jgi:hypothetical protein
MQRTGTETTRRRKTPKGGKHAAATSKSITRRGQIQKLFLARANSYGFDEAVEIIGLSPAALRREVDDDQRDAYRINGEWRFTWRQVAFIALRRWTLAEIHEALSDAASPLPPLLSLRALTIRLPQFLVRAIEVAASANHMSVDEWLRLELTDFAGTVVEDMEAACPGFRRAYLFPGLE